MPSLKVNVVWNSLRTVSNLLFPLITFPYVARILGPENIGIYNYVSSIAGYFILFASLGFPVYGIREVSSTKESKKEFSDSVDGIFTANLISCLLTYIVYLAVSFLIGGGELAVYIVFGFSILLSCISFDWFYQGVEDFKFITIRGLVIKIISVVLLFIFVRTQDGLIAYSIISVIATCGNNIWNLIHIRKYTKLRLNFKSCKKHTKGAFVLFLGTIAVSLYTNLNNIMVGALGNMTDVGLFSTGNKLVHIIITLIAAATATIIPRMSYLVAKGYEDEALALQRKTLHLIYYLGLPMIIGLIILAKPIILLFSGQEYINAIPVIKILSPLILVIPLSSFFGYQILIPLHKEKYGNYCVILGAIINLILNFILIPKYAFIGCSITLLIAELIITLSHYIFCIPFMKLKIADFIPIKLVIAAIIMGMVLYTFTLISEDPVYAVLWIFLGMIIYLSCLIIFKDSFTKNILRTLFRA